MARGSSGKSLGRAVVDFVVNLGGLKRDLREAEAETKQTAEKMEQSTKRVGDGFTAAAGKAKAVDTGLKGAGEQIEKATEPARKFVGSLTSAVGIATGIVGAFTAVAGILALVVSRLSEAGDKMRAMREEAQQTGEAFFDTSRAEAFRRSISGLAEEQRAIAQAERQAGRDIADIEEKLLPLLKEREEIEQRIAAARIGSGNAASAGIELRVLQESIDKEQGLIARRRLDLEEEIREIQRVALENAAREREEAERRANERVKAARQTLQDQLTDATIAAIEDEEERRAAMLRREIEQRKAAAQELANETGDFALADQIANALDVVLANDRKERERQHREQLEAQQRAHERQLKEQEESIKRATEKANQKQVDAMNKLTDTVEQLTGAVDGPVSRRLSTIEATLKSIDAKRPGGPLRV